MANRLLAELAGEELVATSIEKALELRALASENRLVVVNRRDAVVTLRVPYGAAISEALVADNLNARLPGSYRLRELVVLRGEGAVSIDIPAWSVVLIRRR